MMMSTDGMQSKSASWTFNFAKSKVKQSKTISSFPDKCKLSGSQLTRQLSCFKQIANLEWNHFTVNHLYVN